MLLACRPPCSSALPCLLTPSLTCCLIRLLHSALGCWQALNIPTKINKGTVEITTDVHLIHTGTKVGSSEATLLAKLGIKPFSYGLIVQQASPCTLPVL